MLYSYWKHNYLYLKIKKVYKENVQLIYFKLSKIIKSIQLNLQNFKNLLNLLNIIF